MDDQTIIVQTARLTVGQNVFEASGPLKNPTGQGSLKFDGRFVLDQLAKLAGLSAQPSGAIRLTGNAKLSGSSDYLVTGRLEGKDIRVQHGERRLVLLLSPPDSNSIRILPM